MVMGLVGGHLKRFLSPNEYESGRRAGVWACIYLVVTLLVIVSAVADADPDAETGPIAFGATLPMSLVVVTAHGGRMMAALAVCAFVNAFVFWMIFRGSAHYPRPAQTLRVPVAARRKGRFSKHANRNEPGDSLHPRKRV
jgi:hypothetical protein